MRATRSRSAGKVAGILGVHAPSKVSKANPKANPKAVKQANTGALENASIPPKNSETSVLSSPSTSNGNNSVKLPRSPSKASSKASSRPHIEQAFAHILTPPNLELPSDFVHYHTPEFVEAIKHVLRIDSSLYPAVAYGNFEAFARETGLPEPRGPDLITHYWYSLISSVISQQVSGTAAKAIKSRFTDLFAGSPTPKDALNIPLDTLKAVGLSRMKVKYVVHISQVFSDPESNLTSVDFYKNSSTQDLIAELTKLNGIGEWSANMFAVFTLKELDVFAYDDLGVARGVARYLQVRPHLLEETKAGVHAVEELKARLKRKSKFHSDKSKRDWTPVHDEYVKFLALKFEPFRTAFMLVMWRLSSTNIDVLEKK
ncbi:hypothetical protein JCM33374_g2409 [Metschnikowia sp. JCM 33374]|nr:hypothetical protein JCM33374_g2409 [Metschnikowia sp. JCM 33374]